MTKFAVSATLDLAKEERFFESDMFGYDPFKIGVNIGVGLFGLGKMSEASKFFLNKDYSKVSYHHLVSMIPNSIPAQISKECKVRYILKNSFGFGGTNSSIILKINKGKIH